MPPETSALEELVADYHELNSEFVDEIYEQPSALEFMRYVAKNRPFIVRGGALHWPAIQKWNFDYLITVMKNQLVNVAVTPHGNADSVVANPDNGLKYFVKPHEISEPFSDFLRYVQLQELNCDMLSHVKYAQTQNDNLRGEYALLFEDVDADIVWSHVALGQKPEAINLWIGNSRSTTALHRDNYENIYCQVIGHKHFVLVPPVEIASVGEESLRAATYTPANSRASNLNFKSLQDTNVGNLVIVPDEGSESVPCATWNPDTYERNDRPNSRPMRVSLNPGDVLYLPAMWYHKVTQTCSNEGICCAVNYWYDMDFSGCFYSSNAFIRNIALTAPHAKGARVL